MANRPSLWIVLMSLMSIAYCGEDVIKITTTQGEDAKTKIKENTVREDEKTKVKDLKNPYLINIDYGECQRKDCVKVQNVNLSSLTPVKKGDSVNIAFKNFENIIRRIELYVGIFNGRYDYIEDGSITITAQDLPDQASIYHGTWFPLGSEIAEFYIYIHQGNNYSNTERSTLHIKVEVEDGEMKTYLMHRTRQSVTLDIVKEKYTTDKDIVKNKSIQDNRALNEKAAGTSLLILGSLKCKNMSPNFRVDIGLAVIKKAGRGTLHSSAFTNPISNDELIDAFAKFANQQTETPIDTEINTKWAKIECFKDNNSNAPRDGIKLSYSKEVQGLLTAMYYDGYVAWSEKTTKRVI